MLPIEELNQLAPDAFAAALKPLFEAALPLTEALYTARPFASYTDLLERAEPLASALPLARQIDIVNAHPRIGEPAEAVRQTSAASYAEQGYDAEAALPALDLDQIYATLAELNQAYVDQFGFSFVVFMNGRPKSEIITVLRDRLSNSRDVELQTALRDMVLIARDRYARSSMQRMQHQGDDAARLAVLDELRHAALDMYGEEVSAEASLQAALDLAATAVWRVSQELLEPLGNDPLPTYA